MELALSEYLYWAGVVSTGLAVTSYLGVLVWPRLGVGGRLVMQTVDGGMVSLSGQRDDRLRPYGLAALAVWLAVGTLGGALVIRTIETGHAPFSNLFEYSMAFAFGLSLMWAIAERRTPAKATGLVVMGIAFGLAASALMWPSEPQETLVPALQAGWLLPVHVATMLLAYSLLGLAAGAAALFLVQFPGRRFSSLPSPAALDALTARAVIFGFLLLGVGVALGAYWANDAWGRYWGWDPKETASLVTWLLFAVYMHARGLRSWRGRRSAILVLVGFGAVVFTYLAVNLWISGLHSYAGV